MPVIRKRARAMFPAPSDRVSFKGLLILYFPIARRTGAMPCPAAENMLTAYFAMSSQKMWRKEAISARLAAAVRSSSPVPTPEKIPLSSAQITSFYAHSLYVYAGSIGTVVSSAQPLFAA